MRFPLPGHGHTNIGPNHTPNTAQGADVRACEAELRRALEVVDLGVALDHDGVAQAEII